MPVAGLKPLSNATQVINSSATLLLNSALSQPPLGLQSSILDSHANAAALTGSHHERFQLTLSMLVSELEGLNQAENLIYRAAHRQIIYSDLAEDSFAVDDEQTPKKKEKHGQMPGMRTRLYRYLVVSLTAVPIVYL